MEGYVSPRTLLWLCPHFTTMPRLIVLQELALHGDYRFPTYVFTRLSDHRYWTLLIYKLTASYIFEIWIEELYNVNWITIPRKIRQALPCDIRNIGRLFIYIFVFFYLLTNRRFCACFKIRQYLICSEKFQGSKHKIIDEIFSFRDWLKCILNN